MKIRKAGLGWRILRDLLLAAGLILILCPLYLVVINSFKSLEEAGRNFFALPSSFYLENFKNLFTGNNYWGYVKNSFIISVVSICLILLLVPSVSYAIARNYNRKYYKGIYFYLLMGLFIPSQVIMKFLDFLPVLVGSLHRSSDIDHFPLKINISPLQSGKLTDSHSCQQ